MRKKEGAAIDTPQIRNIRLPKELAGRVKPNLVNDTWFLAINFAPPHHQKQCDVEGGLYSTVESQGYHKIEARK